MTGSFRYRLYIKDPYHMICMRFYTVISYGLKSYELKSYGLISYPPYKPMTIKIVTENQVTFIFKPFKINWCNAISIDYMI